MVLNKIKIETHFLKSGEILVVIALIFILGSGTGSGTGTGIGTGTGTGTEPPRVNMWWKYENKSE